MSKNYDRLINNFKLLFPFSKKANLKKYLEDIQATDSIEEYLDMIHYFLCQEKTDSGEPEQSIYINDKENYKKPTLDTMPPLPGLPASPALHVSPASSALLVSPEPPEPPASPASPEPDPETSLDLKPIVMQAEYHEFEDKDAIGGELRSRMLFDVWINTRTASGDKPEGLRNKLRGLFLNNGWIFFDPRGNGFCGMYSLIIEYNNKLKDKSQLILNQNQVYDKIIEGIVNYYQARKQHVEQGIILPEDLTSDSLHIVLGDKPKRAGYDGIEVDELSIEENNIADDGSKATLKALLRKKLAPLNVMPEKIMDFIGYGVKRSFIELRYDTLSRVPNPASIRWAPCYCDLKVNNGQVSYPYINIKYYTSILLVSSAHYWLIDNNDTNIKEEVIKSIIRSTNDEWQSPNVTRLTITDDGLIQRIIEGGFKKIKKQKKLTATTYKNTLRRLRFTTNMKKPKYSIKKN
jgi:hypothetical protein